MGAAPSASFRRELTDRRRWPRRDPAPVRCAVRRSAPASVPLPIAMRSPHHEADEGAGGRSCVYDPATDPRPPPPSTGQSRLTHSIARCSPLYPRPAQSVAGDVNSPSPWAATARPRDAPSSTGLPLPGAFEVGSDISWEVCAQDRKGPLHTSGPSAYLTCGDCLRGPPPRDNSQHCSVAVSHFRHASGAGLSGGRSAACF